MFKRCQRARSGRCLPLLICDYDELHETMLEFLLTIKNPRARAPSFPLIHTPFLSLSLFLCVFLSLFVFRFGLLPACTKTKQAAAAAAAAASRTRGCFGWLACSTHIARDYLMQRAFQTHTHPPQRKAAQRRCSNQRALLVFIMATKRRRPGQRTTSEAKQERHLRS